MVYHVKCRLKGAKAWSFLSRGGCNRLRVHAVTFATKEKAEALIEANAADNPEWDFRVQPSSMGA